MTHIEGRTLVIKDEKPQQCDLCGVVAELRPYGPNGECVCFACGMKDPAAAERAFRARISAVDAVIDLTGDGQ